MLTLILTEKPSVAKEIASAFNISDKRNGAYVGKNYIITWALGHLVTLKSPEELRKDWVTWNLESLPMIPDHFETKVIKETAHQFNNVKMHMNNPSVSRLIIATDAGREGELVARLIIEKVGFKKELKRLWISSMTKRAILDGFNNLKDAKEYERLYLSAKARSYADWLVGLNISRCLTVKYNENLSAGRVQTPTLSLIVSREEEIKNFKSVPYYEIVSKVNGVNLKLLYNKSYQFKTLDEVSTVINEIKNQKFIVTSLKTKTIEESPKCLYDLTTLQQDANKLFGFKAKYTLDLIQKLYEYHKLLTYPRTDSSYLTPDMYDTIPERLSVCCFGKYGKYRSLILSKQLTKSKRIFDSSKVSDHHAIIPTETKPIINSLDTDELKIYELVVKRFIEAFMDNYKYVESIITLTYKDYQFIGSISSPISLGFKELSSTISSTPTITLKEKDEFYLKEISYLSLKTSPKDRYTEATLLYAMEHAKDLVVDSKEKEALAQCSGIGTPATRADIIERIFSAGYVVLSGKSIMPTAKGKQLISLVPKSLTSVALTANQEMNLDLISKGRLHISSFLSNIKEYTNSLINDVINSNTKFLHDNLSSKKCPECGNRLLVVDNKYGQLLKCVNKDCTFKKDVYKITTLRCPTCHKHLKAYKDDTTSLKTFICSCGFKEKETSFFNKVKSNKNQMNRKEVSKFIEKEEKLIPKNNPFEELLKNKR